MTIEHTSVVGKKLPQPSIGGAALALLRPKIRRVGDQRRLGA
jgi:hypothetical protein